MNLPPSRHDELISLFGAIRDERITEAEFNRLEQLLAEDAEARELYVHFMTLHASLEHVDSLHTMAQRVRGTLDDDRAFREFQSMIATEGRSAFASRSPRSKAGRYLAAVVTAAALILVGLFLGQLILRKQSVAACSAEIAAVYGHVELPGASGDTRITPGTVLEPGRSVMTGPNASVRLQYQDSSTVDLKAGTKLTLLEGAGAKRLKLVTGSAYFDVASQASDAPLIVNPGQYDQVKVMGTSFQISRDKKGETRVLVADGTVLFGADDKAVRIESKQGSVARPRKKPSQPTAFKPTAIWQGLSRGLTATYYDREDLTGKSVTRVDPSVDFHWGKSSPDSAIPSDRFSARWTGRIEAEHTEAYTLYVLADEGARLWIDGKLMIDAWKNARGKKLSSPPIELVAGRTYDLKLEYHEAKDTAKIQLLWYSRSTSRTIVPHSQLHPSP